MQHAGDADALKVAIEVVSNFACADNGQLDEEEAAALRAEDEEAMYEEDDDHGELRVALAATTISRDDEEAAAGAAAGKLPTVPLVAALPEGVVSRFVVDDGALGAIIAAARTHGNRSPALLASALDALTNLADDLEALPAMVAEGAGALVVSVLAQVAKAHMREQAAAASAGGRGMGRGTGRGMGMPEDQEADMEEDIDPFGDSPPSDGMGSGMGSGMGGSARRLRAPSTEVRLLRAASASEGLNAYGQRSEPETFALMRLRAVQVRPSSNPRY